MTTRAEKIRQTVIERYGSYEAYLEARYHNPKAIADRQKMQREGGRVSKNRPFKDPVKAREAYQKGIGKQRGAGK